MYRRILAQTILVLTLFLTSEVCASKCTVDTMADSWGTTLKADKQQQATYLAKLKGCLPDDRENQAIIDTLAIMSLENLDELPEASQVKIVDFVIQALEINAKAGYASSQHNYAMLFNERPGSLLTKLIKQDQMKFGFWTKMAAAQGEPRALFNLAMRMAVGLKEAGIAKDLKTAYKLLIILEQLYVETNLENYDKQVLDGIMPFIVQTKVKIERTLGEKQSKQLAESIVDFNYSSLAP